MNFYARRRSDRLVARVDCQRYRRWDAMQPDLPPMAWNNVTLHVDGPIRQWSPEVGGWVEMDEQSWSGVFGPLRTTGAQ